MKDGKPELNVDWHIERIRGPNVLGQMAPAFYARTSKTKAQLINMMALEGPIRRWRRNKPITHVLVFGSWWLAVPGPPPAKTARGLGEYCP